MTLASVRIDESDAVPVTLETGWAEPLAAELVASDGPAPHLGTYRERLLLAWAVKDCAIAAWSSDPSAVARAAHVLSQLVVDDASALPASQVELQAVCAWVGGIAALTRGGMTDAITQLDDATAKFRLLGLSGHAAHAQVPKIMALSMLGLGDEAAACGERTQAELVALKDNHGAAKVSLNLGNLYYGRNLFADAKRNYSEATTLFALEGDAARCVAAEIGMADAFASTGEFDLALSTYERAQHRALGQDLHVPNAVIQESVALVNLARGRYRDALIGLEGARREYEALSMPQNLATAEKQLGDAYLYLRLLPEALALFDCALLRFESLEMPVEQAWGLTQRGRALAALSRQPEEVADCLHRAWELFAAQGVTAGQATVLLARAELALSQHDPEAASMFAGDAANVFAANAMAFGGAQADVLHAHALLECGEVDAAAGLFAGAGKRARELQLLSVGVRCEVGLGLVAKARGNVIAAEAAFESAISASEEQRSALPGDEIRDAFLMDQLRPYEELLRIALDALDHMPSSDAAARVLVQLERFRARVLGERLGEPKLGTTATQTDKAEDHLRARLSWLYRRRQKLIDDGDDPQSLMVEARQAERDLLELARRRLLTGEASVSLGDAVAFDPTVLRMALRDGEALIEYGVIDDELFACVVTRERVALQRRIARWPEVVEAIRTARFQIETLRYGADTVHRHLDLLTRRSRAAMRRVHELVWAPIQPLLIGCSEALVVAHDQLGSLQFAALYDGENYLAQTMRLTMAPSARVALYGIAHKPVAAKRALVLGESSRLVHAADEAQFVAGLFDNANVLTGARANAVALRALCMDADVLHLACHAEFRTDNPMFSALQLVDGPFNVQDAETLQLRQGIVVLSACETGVAVYSRGDEMIGLVRAFLVAGASRVVASLWPVDDAVTLQFMAAFYRSLRDGNAPSIALRAAQLDVMATHPHPFYWAAFTLYGGW